MPKVRLVLDIGGSSAPVGTARDTAALLLSIVPGLGLCTKTQPRRRLADAGAAFAVFACGLIATATMGFGLLLAALLVWVMLQVY